MAGVYPQNGKSSVGRRQPPNKSVLDTAQSTPQSSSGPEVDPLRRTLSAATSSRVGTPAAGGDLLPAPSRGEHQVRP